MDQIKFSVIVPVGRTGSEKKIEETVRKNDFPQEQIEIIFVAGADLPGEKRNVGAFFSKGEYLVFIDDDVELEGDYFAKLKKILDRGDIDVVGGPNRGPESGNRVQRMIDRAFQSRLGFGKGAERFRNKGTVIKGNEDNLTACNLCIKKSTFVSAGGFDKRLFPGEEVELIRRLRLQKYHLIYHPDIQVIHHRRTSLRGLWKQVFCYGRGRADLIARKGFEIRDISYLVPSCVVVYILLLPLMLMIFPASPYTIGVLAYLAVLLIYCLKEGIANKLDAKETATLFAVFITIHIAYGCGMLSRLKSLKAGDD